MIAHGARFDSPSMRMLMLRRNLKGAMPAEEPRTFAAIPVGSAIAVNGYLYRFEGVRLKGRKPVDGEFPVAVDVSRPDTPNPTHPRLPAGVTGSLSLKFHAGVAIVSDEYLLSVHLEPIWHPLDWCILNPTWHYPACGDCVRLWPCEHATASLTDVAKAEAVNRRRKSCHHCGDWLRGRRYFKFGRGPVRDIDRLNPTVPLTGVAKPTLVAEGTAHIDYAGDSFEPVQFCHKSKCITVAYAYGRDHGCPIPVRRKDLDLSWDSARSWPIEIDMPGRELPTQPPAPEQTPVLKLISAS